MKTIWFWNWYFITMLFGVPLMFTYSHTPNTIQLIHVEAIHFMLWVQLFEKSYFFYFKPIGNAGFFVCVLLQHIWCFILSKLHSNCRISAVFFHNLLYIHMTNWSINTKMIRFYHCDGHHTVCVFSNMWASFSIPPLLLSLNQNQSKNSYRLIFCCVIALLHLPPLLMRHRTSTYKMNVIEVF